MFTEDGEIIDFSDYEFIAEGQCAKIYKHDNEVLKVYKYDCSINYYFRKKVFKLLKDLNIPNLVKLYNYYYFHPGKISHLFSINAYTMEYVSKDNLDILNLTTDNLLKIVASLEETGKLLADSRIRIYDAHHSNIIFSEQGATIIDLDLFRIANLSSIKKLYLENLKQIFHYIESEISNQLSNNEYYGYWVVLPRFKENVPLLDQFASYYDEETPLKSIEKRLTKKG